MSSEASSRVSDDDDGKPMASGNKGYPQIGDFDALHESRGPRSHDRTSRPPSISLSPSPIRSTGQAPFTDSGSYDGDDEDAHLPCPPELPDISSAASVAGSNDSFNPPGEDDHRKSSAENPLFRHEDRSRAREDPFNHKKELLKRKGEDLRRNKERLKPRDEIGRREDELRRGDDSKRDAASLMSTSFAGHPTYYQHGMPLAPSYQGISPPQPSPLYPSSAIAPAYITESGVARTRPTDLQPGGPAFNERFVQEHGGGSRLAVECTVHMRDVFREFSVCELAGGSFWDLVVLVGRPGQQQIEGAEWATTCRDYVAHTWPQSVEGIKEFFSLLAANGSKMVTKKELVSSSGGDVLVVTSRPSSMLGEKELSLSFEGPAKCQADMVESLTWLFAVLQSSQADERPIASGIRWSPRRSDPTQARNSYQLTNDLSEPLRVPYYSACWTPLLPRTACAIDFGTRPRPREMQGLELSFELMCFLSGLEYEVVEKEGLVLYGQRSMVFPVHAVANCVQWHFQPYSPDRSLHSQVTQKRMLVDDLDDLREAKRHFLGLWSDPKIVLGTESVDDMKIGWSAAEEVLSETTRDGTILGGSIAAPKVLTLNWSQTYKVARSRKNQYMVNFEANLHRMINSPVILYSPSERRAWMVSFVSVLLHLARARAFFQKSLGFHVPPCESRGNGGQAAFDCLRAHYRQPLKQAAENETLTEEEQKFSVENYVNEVSAAMECARRESCRANGILRRVREKIIGFELADIARMKPTLRMKQHSLDTFATRSWAPLLDEVQLTFFYEGLPDPIVPSETSLFPGVCGRSCWRTIPRGFNLLAVSLPCLAHLAEDRNWGNHTLQRLTHDMSWHCPGEVYRMCNRQTPHACCRLQELAPRGRAKSPELPISDAEGNGAVVFRYADSFSEITESLNPAVSIATRQSENEIPSELESPLSTPESLAPAQRPALDGHDSGYLSGGSPNASANSIQPSLVGTPGTPRENLLPDQSQRLEVEGTTRSTQPPRHPQRRRHQRYDSKAGSKSSYPGGGGSKPRRSEKVHFRLF